MTTRAATTSHTMLRLDIPTGRAFDAFCSAYEDAVPAVDMAGLERLVATGDPWSAIEAQVAENAPHGFMIYAKIDTTPVMAAAGHRRPAVEYLMGNHVLAERMFRHDPAALLYAPLRVLVHADGAGDAVLVLDQPSTVFAGLGRPEIDVVAADLDAKIAALLVALDVPVPGELLSGD